MSKSDTIWRRLRKKGKGLWWLPVVTAVLGFLCAALFNLVRTPMYEVTTDVVIFYGDSVYVSPEELVQITSIYDDVTQRLELPGGSSELTSAVQIQRPSYNLEMVIWVERWRWRLPGIVANWIPRPPPPPRHNMEIRVRHSDPIIATQIGSTLVDAYNQHLRSTNLHLRSTREDFIVTQIARLATNIHTTMIELALAKENQSAEVEQATLSNKLEVLLTNYVLLVESVPLEVTYSPPLTVVETPTVPLAPIHTKRNLLVGTSAGALMGFILYMVRGKQNE